MLDTQPSVAGRPDVAATPSRFVFTDEHEALRRSIRAFVDKEIVPHVDEWEETTFPDSIVRRMGELGFLGLSVPEGYGGQGGATSPTPSRPRGWGPPAAAGRSLARSAPPAQACP